MRMKRRSTKHVCRELDANQSLVDGDINKCDNERVEVRSRLVAREINQKGTDSYFAGTPPIAFVRCVTSRAATLSKTGK